MARPPRYWIKLDTDILNDPKLGRLPVSARWHFVQLLALAGKYDTEGYLIDGKRTLDVCELAWLCRVTEEQIESDLECLLQAGFIDQDGDVWYIPSLRGGRIHSQAEGSAYQQDTRSRQQSNAPEGELQDVAPSVNREHPENDDRWDEQCGCKSPSDDHVLLHQDSKLIRNGYAPVTNRYQNMIEQSYPNVTNRNQNYNERGYDPVTKRIKNSRQYRYSSVTDIDIDKESDKESEKEGEESVVINNHQPINIPERIKFTQNNNNNNLSPTYQNHKSFGLSKNISFWEYSNKIQDTSPNCMFHSLSTFQRQRGRSPPALLRYHPVDQ